MSLIAEQNLVVVLNTFQLSKLGNDQIPSGDEIGVSAKTSKLYGFLDSISVSFIRARLKNENAPVLIIISEDRKNDYGEQLHSFKQRLLKNFKDVGISLQNNDIIFDFRDNQYITNLLSSAKTNVTLKPQTKGEDTMKKEADEYDYEEKAKHFSPKEPLYSFNRVILSLDVVKKIEQAVAILECENKVFNEWGLYEIQPNPSTALSFFGPSGTGKTMAAEAVAQKLGKKILKVSYADVESKYHGEGPKMVKTIFSAAQKADAVLFFDEADSLLSKRLTNVSQGSEQAINSMRSQLLICLEEYRGIVIFATNLISNYDKAFLTRLISVEFPIPDAETRKRIWDVHIRPVNDGKKYRINIPLNSDVNTIQLSQKYDFVGREIRNAVVSACVNAAMEGKSIISQTDFIHACDNIIVERDSLKNVKDHNAQDPKSDVIKAALLDKINKEEKQNNVLRSIE